MAEAISLQDPFGLYRRRGEDGLIDYAAGLPGFPENFSRDIVIAGLVATDLELLRSQLSVSAQRQGRTNNPRTGEQFGRIHHQFPGVPLDSRGDYLTTYNACDTTALFLIAAGIYLRLSERQGSSDEAYSYLGSIGDSLMRAVMNVEACTGSHDNLFREKPPEGADRFALRVTYWKDSILPHDSSKAKLEPQYPVAYGLAQFIAARGLLAAGEVMNDDKLRRRGQTMIEVGIREFMRPDGYVVYQDSTDELVQASSDELHALAYIPADYVQALPLEIIENRAAVLATPFGYVCTPPSVRVVEDGYHADVIWSHEQALLHYGAHKFQLAGAATIASRLGARRIGRGQELFDVIRDDKGRAIDVQARGNPLQLWATAAAMYFDDRWQTLRQNPIL